MKFYWASYHEKSDQKSNRLSIMLDVKRVAFALKQKTEVGESGRMRSPAQEHRAGAPRSCDLNTIMDSRHCRPVLVATAKRRGVAAYIPLTVALLIFL